MSKKVVVLAVLLVIAAIAVSVSFFVKEEGYSDDPKKWLEKNGRVIEVSVDKATKGEGYLDVNGQQYRSENVNTMFRYEGYYKGSRFVDVFNTINNQALMRITKDLQPSDGIIDGFIVVRIENDVPIFNIFIDNDWKNRVVPTNILHGVENKIEKLNFEELRPGIFYAKFITDEGFFDDFQFHLGSIMVGDFTQEKIDNENNDITMMVVQ